MSDHREEDLHSLASEFSIKSTELSTQIEDFEKYLISLKGNIAVSVETSAGPIKYQRYRNEWRLIYESKQVRMNGDVSWTPRLVIEGPLHVKIAVAKASKELVDTLYKTHKSTVGDLRIALKELNATLNEQEG